MTISKRNSRTIVGDNEMYRWTVSPDSGYLVFVAEHGIVRGKRIEVYVTSESNGFWTSFPDVNDMNLKVIKPSDVSQFITQAINHGWNPKEAGRPIAFDLSGDTLLKRISLN
ncbi:hypothetical protein OB236_00785 [Paenibacillus sp. WQ 127069]|uniref:Uncharacterized protein n=1 Tax=Paenibacillus baimaensis TaxID=2982185 RepID=A0ABT2U7P4_9BACL|nr:hypothetical protein [Paenibacillus sp. WQ 127069]MCU6790650.1 hypothetical protein [Paenibacillus sp. WQ 127069]